MVVENTEASLRLLSSQGSSVWQSKCSCCELRVLLHLSVREKILVPIHMKFRSIVTCLLATQGVVSQRHMLSGFFGGLWLYGFLVSENCH